MSVPVLSNRRGIDIIVGNRALWSSKGCLMILHFPNNRQCMRLVLSFLSVLEYKILILILLMESA